MSRRKHIRHGLLMPDFFDDQRLKRNADEADEVYARLHTEAFYNAGEMVLCPSMGLIEALIRTEPPAEFRLPYPSLWVAFEGEVAIDPSTDIRAFGMVISEASFIEDLGRLTFDRMIGSPEFRAFVESRPEGAGRTDEDLMSEFMGFIADCSSQMTVGRYVVRVDGFVARGRPQPALEKDSGDLQKFLPLAANLAAYFESCGADAVDTTPRDHRAALLAKAAKAGPKKARRLKRKAERAGGATLVYLGRSFSQPHEPTGNRSTAREHWVRGHWRNQPYGFGRRQVRRRWIQPHIRCRGSSAGRVEGRTYRATGDDE